MSKESGELHLELVPNGRESSAEPTLDDQISAALSRFKRVLEDVGKPKQSTEHGVKLIERWSKEKPLKSGVGFAIACQVEVYGTAEGGGAGSHNLPPDFSEEFAMAYKLDQNHIHTLEYLIQFDTSHPVLSYENDEYVPVSPDSTPQKWQEFTRIIDALEQPDPSD